MVVVARIVRECVVDFFFFQAEDGIRDYKVTGVQTCALPIFHHAHTEQPGDPHSPREGRWWAHMGWILQGTAQQHDDAVMRRYAPDLMKDPVHVWLNRLYFVPLILCGIALLALGGWPALMWGVFFRVTFGLHATWLVNSATHLWGSRRFETTDDSTN